jgi:succinate dehydrogenase/fumarate reductase flavoprotein subunit
VRRDRLYRRARREPAGVQLAAGDLKGLDAAERELAELAEHTGAAPSTENWEATNLLTVAAALVHAARQREETRGSHWRDDFPGRDDDRWRGHLDTTLSADGLRTDFVASVSP